KEYIVTDDAVLALFTSSFIFTITKSTTTSTTDDNDDNDKNDDVITTTAISCL
ncbi:hypothetical protein CHS0354_031999, partial [Potamilus streckersoni]